MWLPPVTVEMGGWRVTQSWRMGDDGPVLVGVTVLTEGDGPLSRQVLDRLAPAIFADPDRRAVAAGVYKRALDRGDPPTKAVAAEMGIGVDSAYNLVVKLRHAGLLPPTTPGRAVA